ncbi:MAG: alpha/beta hydrolase [Planctomycetota bacterium]
MKLITTLSVSISLLSSGALADGPRHLTYATEGGNALDAFVYSPSVDAETLESPIPAILMIHGGGWVMGSPWFMSRQSQALADEGFVVINIEYRLTDRETGLNAFPIPVHDTKAAVRWTRANAAALNVDPDHIGAVGGSAGAHLASLLATSGDVEELEGDVGEHGNVSSEIQAAVGWAAPFDLIAVAEVDPDDWDGVLAAFMGGTFDEVPENYYLASPAEHMDATDPPVLLLHEFEERIVFPTLQTEAFERGERIIEGFEVVNWEGEEHAFWVPGRGEHDRAEQTIQMTAEFFRKHLSD